jgi:hypothetical protein
MNLKKENIKLIILGSNMSFLDKSKIIKHKSKIFQIVETKIISNLPDPNHLAFYLDQKYLDSQLMEILGPDEDIARIGLINCRLENNFYVRRIFDKTVVISINIPMQIESPRV